MNDRILKAPPSSIDLEEAVIGAILIDPKALEDVVLILNKNDFYSNKHQAIYEAVSQLDAKESPVDILTVTDQLRSNGKLDLVGGSYEVSKMTNRIASSANIEGHARIVKQFSLRRQLIKLSASVGKIAYDETIDVLDGLEIIDREFNEVNSETTAGGVTTVDSALRSLVESWKSANKDGLTGYATGLKDYDSLTSGLGAGQFVVWAARPGMGKTTLMLQAAMNAYENYGLKTGIITLEMPARELVAKFLSAKSKVYYNRLTKNTPLEQEMPNIMKAVSDLSSYGIYIVDRPSMNESQFKAEARRLKREYQVDCIMVDYLQLFSTNDSKKTRDQGIGEVSRSMKAMAKLLEIPVVALSQLNRSVESRGGDKRPQLSDLRESGAIEQDADIVTFLYRAEYYDILQDDEGNSTAGKIELITAKHRGGRTMDVTVSSELEYSLIYDEIEDQSWTSPEVKQYYEKDDNEPF